MANLVGKTLKNRYRVEESLGRGGMADVYKVWDMQRSAYLAMKVLRDDLAQDPIFLRRFQREAKALAGLQHPNIVRFYGMERDDLLAFLLMEYVDGVSLQAEILRAEGKPLPMERVKEVMGAVTSALYYAHNQGLVHCDIKPGNILLDKHGGIYLTDFGIARGMDAATSTMVGIGTPAYMAPELIKGQDPSPQTDIYALGIVLYEMLTGGERPFTGERAGITGTTAEKVRWEHLELPYQPISTYNTDISDEIATIIDTCLQKQPEKRFDSVEMLVSGFTKNEIVNHTPGMKDRRTKTEENELRSIPEKHSIKEEQKKIPEKKSKKRIKRIALVSAMLLLVIGFLAVFDHFNLFPNSIGSNEEEKIEKSFLLDEIVKENIHNLDLYESLGYGEIIDVFYSPRIEKIVVGTRVGFHLLDPMTLEITDSYVSQDVDGIVLDIAVSHNSDLAAIALSKGTVQIINLKNLTLDSFFQLIDTEVIGVEFNSSASMLACATEDYSVELWDIRKQEIIHTYMGFGEAVSDIAFSSNGKLMATSSFDDTVVIWNTATYQQVKTFYDFQYGAVAVEFSSDSSMLAMAENVGKIFIHDTSDWALISEIEANHQGSLFSMSFSEDGEKIVSSGIDGNIKVWDISTGDAVEIIDRHGNYVYSICFVSGDNSLVSGSLDGTVRLWDLYSGEQRAVLNGFQDFVWAIFPIEDQTMFFTETGDGGIAVWDTETFEKQYVITYPRYFLGAVDFSYNGAYMAYESGNLINIASMEEENVLFSLEGFDSAVYAIDFSKFNGLAAAGGNEGIVKVYDLFEETLLHEISLIDEPIEYLDFAGWGDQLIVILEDILYDVYLPTYGTEDEINFVAPVDSPILDVAKDYVHEDLYCAFSHGDVGVYNADIHQFEFYDFSFEKPITNVAISNDSLILALAIEDGDIEFRDSQNGNLLNKIPQNKGTHYRIEDMAFSGDGKYFLILGNDAVLRVYAIKDGTHLVNENLIETTTINGLTIERERYSYPQKVFDWIEDGERLKLFSQDFKHPNSRLGEVIDLYVQCISCENMPYVQISSGDGCYDNGAWSPDGDMIAVLEGHCMESDLVLFNLNKGEKITIRGVSPHCRNIDWSPNGNLLAYSTIEGSLNVLNLDTYKEEILVGSEKIQANSEDINDLSWSPDQKKIAFWTRMGENSNDERGWQIWVVDADGTNLKNLGEQGYGQTSVFWSEDTGDLVYRRFKILEEDIRGEYETLIMDTNGQIQKVLSQGERVVIRNSIFFPHYSHCSDIGCSDGFWDEW